MKYLLKTLFLALSLLTLFGLIGTEAEQPSPPEPEPVPVYRAGELLRLRTSHQTGQILTYDVDGVAHGLLMREVKPGGYLGEFLILPSFKNGRRTITIRDLESGEIVSTEEIIIRSSAPSEIQATTSGDDLIVGFDETISSATVVVTSGSQTFEINDGIISQSNFFKVEGLKNEGNRPVNIRARTIEGEQLERTISNI